MWHKGIAFHAVLAFEGSTCLLFTRVGGRVRLADSSGDYLQSRSRRS